MEKILNGDRQGVGGVINLPGGIKTPGVEGLPRGDETSGATPKGDGVLGGDRRERGGEENYPSTQDTKGAQTAPGIIMDAGRHGPAA